MLKFLLIESSIRQQYSWMHSNAAHLRDKKIYQQVSRNAHNSRHFFKKHEYRTEFE